MHIDTTAEEERELRNFVEHAYWQDATRAIQLIGRIVLRILQAAEKEADCQMEQTERLNP